MSEALVRKILLLAWITGILVTNISSIPRVQQRTWTTLTNVVSSPPLGRPFWTACTIEATLKDWDDNPLPNCDVDFLYKCEDHTHPLGTAKTDSNGVASLTNRTCFGFPSGEVWRIKATFSGNTDYAPSSSEYVNLNIPDYTPFLILIYTVLITAVAIGAVAYIIYRRGK